VHQKDEAALLIANQLHGRRRLRVGAATVEIRHVLDIAPKHLKLAQVGASVNALRLIRVRVRVEG